MIRASRARLSADVAPMTTPWLWQWRQSSSVAMTTLVSALAATRCLTVLQPPHDNCLCQEVLWSSQSVGSLVRLFNILSKIAYCEIKDGGGHQFEILQFVSQQFSCGLTYLNQIWRADRYWLPGARSWQEYLWRQNSRRQSARDFFYRAMHFSAYARSWDRMSSVCPSVCDVGGLWSHKLEILETNCTDN